MRGDLTALSTSVSERAESIQKIASGLHRKGVNSVEWELGSSSEQDGCDEDDADHSDAGSESSAPTAPAVAEAAPTPAASTPILPLSEEQLATELCAMAKHASRASGRAPLRPPELVRHESLDRVRAIVQTAAAKGGAHTPSSRRSTKR